MALPLIAGLNALARQALPLIRGGVTRKLSSRAISDTLKKTFGKSIGRNTLLKIIRAYKTIDSKNSQLKFLPKLSRPNPNRLPFALTKLKRKYAFVVEIKGLITGTETSIVQNLTITTNEILSRLTMENIALKIITDNAKRYKIIDVIAKLVSGLRAGPEGTLP